MKAVPRMSRLGFKELTGLVACGVLEGTVIDAVIDSRQRQSFSPEIHLLVPNAIFEEVPRI